ncbi:MAG: hypothetical protein ACKO7W_23090, partial [Elainella sp.]
MQIDLTESPAGNSAVDSAINSSGQTATPSAVAAAQDATVQNSVEFRSEPTASTTALPPTIANDSESPADQITAERSESGTTASAPSVTISAETCLADCNPSERFFFNPPTNLAIPPRAMQQPMLAQDSTRYGTQYGRPLPVPSAPAASGSPDSLAPVSPPPISTPLTRPAPDLAPSSNPDFSTPADATALQSPSSGAGSAADLADTESRRALTPPSLQFQGVYLYQGGEDSARLLVTGVYPILPELQVGASID